MQANIQPVTFFKNTAVVLRIDGVQIRNLGEGGAANILCSFLTNEDRTVGNELVQMSGEDYSLWGSDDNYVLNYALTKLGLTAAEG